MDRNTLQQLNNGHCYFGDDSDVVQYISLRFAIFSESLIAFHRVIEMWTELTQDG